ncbi:hypothetical protein CLV51_10470 [Chitinophaga niastensis]|uniref:Uncharacterized protein n=1 Tax=Chitinophaga niastensis TaxID=536980 RepID=A0A2P8HGM2_CHINA|nr:hypothetical protein [Chitinophaga niastensis]PSL45368.1 hypothetical protein CLV51_10470 [Chitinophaga niastensis]
MKQRYEILTTIHYRHTFLQAQPYEGIGIRISAAAGRQLLNEDLVLKQQPAGIVLLYNTLSGSGRTRKDMLQSNITLTFEVVLKDSLFYNYTQVSTSAITEQIFIFSNAPGNAAGVLHKAAYVGADDLCELNTLPETFFVKPLGQLTLQLNETLQDTYYIRFQSKSTYWCYFLMSDQLASLANPVILEANGAVYFNTPQLADVAGKSKVPVLISNQPISLTKRTPYLLKLADQLPEEKDKYKVIISLLPTPEIDRISAAGTVLQTNDKAYSEIFLY